MKTKITKLISLLLCLFFCLALLPSCRRADPLAQNGIRTVELIKKGKLDILVTMNASVLEAHKNQKTHQDLRNRFKEKDPEITDTGNPFYRRNNRSGLEHKILIH